MSQPLKSRVRPHHLIVDDTFYHNDGSSRFDRDRVVFQHLQFTGKLGALMPELFPTPPQDLLHVKSSADQTDLGELWPGLDAVSKLLYRKTYTIVQDGDEITFEKTYKIGPSNFILTLQEVERLRQCYEHLSKKKGRLSLQILGTAASVPTMANNVQSFCLEVPSFRLLIDCGSNTFYQLYCAYGPTQIGDVLKSVGVIFISHFHSDHHLGIITLLSEKFRLCRSSPVTLMIPQNLLDWYTTQLQLLVSQNNLPDNLITLITHKEYTEDRSEKSQLTKLLLHNSGLNLEILPVVHCFYSAALKVICDGQTLVFSCDRDGQNLANDRTFLEKAQGCDVLIHEATFADTQLSRAKLVNHSTLTQAVLTAMKVGARNLVLTHFTSECLKQVSECIGRDGQLNKDVYREYVKHVGVEGSGSVVEYLESKTVFTQDLMKFDTTWVGELPQLSRLIIKYSPYM